jgi:4-hydroxybutyryl-CoA dehydratase/vinylacetyl-CoA-Delta-isomerase
MSMMTGNEYRESLRRLKPEIYYLGEKIESVADHPAFIPHVNAAALTYEMALAPEFEELLSTTSHLTGEKINRYTHIHHSHDDLVKKVKMMRSRSADGQLLSEMCWSRWAQFGLFCYL